MYFSKEIQMNLTNQAIMQQKEQANVVLDQTKGQKKINNKTLRWQYSKRKKSKN